MPNGELSPEIAEIQKKFEQKVKFMQAQLKNESSRLNRELERHEKTQNIIINLMTGVIIAFFIVFILIALDYFSHHHIHV